MPSAVLSLTGSSGIAAIFTQRVVIGVSDLAVSNDGKVVLSTYALGSCIGVIAYDDGVKAGGILHLMLPNSSIAPGRALHTPAMFADTGLPCFFRALSGIQAKRPRLRLLVAGGACVLSGEDQFRIGERNIWTTMDYLTRNGYNVAYTETGGTVSRTVHLDMGTGTVTLKTPTETGQLSLNS